MKTQKQFVAAALDLNKVFALEPPIESTLPLAELKQRILLASDLIEASDAGRFKANTVEVLVELKAHSAGYLLDAASNQRLKKSTKRHVTIVEDERSIVVLERAPAK